MKYAKRILPLVILLSISGCASYRTNSDIDFDSTELSVDQSNIQILESGMEEGSFEFIGKVDAIVKKLTIFHKNPTKEQVDVVLSQKASKLNADAVINVKYKSGVGATTWGYMSAKGDAVKVKKAP